jgi:cellulose synthase/poly-beta-1,6-N-acetylglucosamine synthase-like glycosyltransferase
MGKPEITNLLTEEAKGEIFIITDANVFLQESTLFEIVRHFKNPDIGLVDTKMFHRGEAVHGISYQENTYMNWEYNIKEMESKAWGTMMGPFGGCFAIRRKLFAPIPENYLVDDFYLNMLVLSRKYKAILSSQAVVTEDVSIDLREELRRKIRIAAGNFQNLSRFLYLLWPPYSPESFCFLSHKVLRWLGPFFIIMAFITNIFLADKPLYGYLLIIQIIIFLIPLADFLMKKLRFNIVALRFITHFLSMNLALLIGFTRYISGINSNIWQPTRRNQGE